MPSAINIINKRHGFEHKIVIADRCPSLNSVPFSQLLNATSVFLTFLHAHNRETCRHHYKTVTHTRTIMMTVANTSSPVFFPPFVIFVLHTQIHSVLVELVHFPSYLKLGWSPKFGVINVAVLVTD